MKRLSIFLIALSLLLSACGEFGLEGQVLTPVTLPSPTSAGASAADPTPGPTATVPPTPAPDPTALCPLPGEAQALYLSRENGYCFLYPADFTIEPDALRPAQGVNVRGPVVIRGMDGVALVLGVYSNGPADGLDSQAYARKWLTAYRMDPGLPVQAISLNGQPAALVDGVPGGMFTQRTVFVAAGGYKYQLTISPEPEMEPELTEAANLAWGLMLQSLTFFPPATPLPLARTDEICPQAGADTQALVDEAQGFCLLYPADFELSADFPGQIIGGPVLADTSDWGKIRTSITLATYDQPLADLPQVPTPPTEQLDPASVQQTTIGGAPAVIYDFTGGPWRQRTASILANNSQYTLVGPWDAEQFPQGVADAQRLWDTITGSIVFFEKWR